MRWWLVAVLVGALVLVACASTSNSRPAADDAWPVADGDGAPDDSPSGEAPADAETALEPTTLVTVTYSGIVDHLALVIRDATGWHNRWAEIVSDQEPKPDPPAVDFDRQMVLLVGLGERPSGGYSVEIVEVILRDGELLVLSMEQIPEPRCAVTRAITSPVVAATVPRTDAPVVFEHRTLIYECPDPDGG
jgi:hypothetical protein